MLRSDGGSLPAWARFCLFDSPLLTLVPAAHSGGGGSSSSRPPENPITGCLYQRMHAANALSSPLNAMFCGHVLSCAAAKRALPRTLLRMVRNLFHPVPAAVWLSTTPTQCVLKQCAPQRHRGVASRLQGDHNIGPVGCVP